jgi:hypothetical protein
MRNNRDLIVIIPWTLIVKSLIVVLYNQDRRVVGGEKKARRIQKLKNTKR